MANTLKFKRGLLAGIPTAALGEPLFTTDTFDLYIGNGTGNTKFQKFIASGATTQIIRGDGSLYTFPLAISSPSSGQVLKYNGTSWVNDSDAGITGSGAAGQVAYFTGATTQGGSNNLFWDATNNRLGIGLTTPATSLAISGSNNTILRGIILRNSSGVVSSSVTLDFETSAGTHGDEGTMAGRISGIRLAAGTSGALSFSTTNAGVLGERMRIDNLGNVGIGLQTITSAPSYKSINISGTNGSEIYLYVGSTHYGYIYGDSNGMSLAAQGATRLEFLTNATQRARITSGGNFIINNASTDNGLRFQVTGDGYFSGGLGLGTSTLTAKLDIVSSTAQASADVIQKITYGTIGATAVNKNAIYISPITASAFDIANSIRHFETGDISLTASGANRYVYGSYYGIKLGAFTTTGVTGILTSHYHINLGNMSSATTSDLMYGIYIGTISGGASGYGIYSNVASGTGRWNLYMNGTAANYLNGSLGIGVTPTTKLDVQGIIASRASAFTYSTIDGNTDGNLYITANAGAANTTNSNIIFRSSTSGSAVTERMRLDASGNLGLGVTPSAWSGTFRALQIGLGTSLYNNAGGNGTFLGSNFFYNGTNNIYLNSTTASAYGQTGGQHQWFTAPSGTAGNAITFTQAMTLDASGRLLVGGTSTYDFNDAAKLVVANTSANSTISIVSGTSSYGYLAFADGTSGTDRYTGVIEYNHSTNYMSFRTNGGNYVMNLTASQNVQIGSFGSDAGYKLDVNGTMRVSGAATFSSSVTVGETITSTGILQNAISNSPYSNSAWVRGASGVGIFLVNEAVTRWIGIKTDNTLDFNGAATFNSSVTFSGNLTVDTNTFFVDSNNNRVGIGTTTPGYPLDVQGTARVSSQIDAGSHIDLTGLLYHRNNIAVLNKANTGWVTWATRNTAGSESVVDLSNVGTFTSSGNLTVDTNTFFVDSSANRVGIGTASPLYDLHVTGNGYFGDNVRFPNLKGCVFVQTGGSLLGSIAMDSSDELTIENNGFPGVSVGVDFTMTGGNLGIGTNLFGTSATKTFSVVNGTAPTTSPANVFQLYSADITAGNAAPHFRTENGGIIKLYQQTTAVTSATYIGGAGTTVTDLDTFDGYTIPQIVKALRNAGLLA